MPAEPAQTPPSRARIAVPSALTLAGVLCGFASMSWAADRPYSAGVALLIASLFDMVDGRVARKLRATSAFGAELDSLADVVSFGIAPAWLLYQTALRSPSDVLIDPWLLLPFAFVAAGAVRLARFNVMPDQSDGWEFRGVPIPAAALFLATFVMASIELEQPALLDRALAAPVVVLGAAVMVAPLPYPSYKRFRRRTAQLSFYTSIGAGLFLLLVKGPGGTVMLGILGLYLVLGTLRGLTLRLGGKDPTRGLADLDDADGEGTPGEPG